MAAEQVADLDFAMLGCDTLPDFASTFQQQPIMQINGSHDAQSAMDSQGVPTIDLVTGDHGDGGPGMVTPVGRLGGGSTTPPTHIPISCACCGHQSRDDDEANTFVHVGPLAPTHKC